MAGELIAAGQLDEKWRQQVHRDCGGEIVIIVQPEHKQLAACCKGCRAMWKMPEIRSWPANW